MDWLLTLLHPLAINFGPPATEQQIGTFEEQIGAELPGDLRQLYRLFNGYENTDSAHSALPMRFHSLEESVTLQGTGENWPGLPAGAQPFWTDDQSNHALVYLSGPLRGMVVLLYHDEPDYAPRYRSALSFLLHLYAAGTMNHYEEDSVLTADLPVLEPRLSSSQTAEDRRLYQICRTDYEQATTDQERFLAAVTAMNLLPYEDTDELEEFTLAEDFYIGQRACEIYGKRRWEDAEELLLSLSKNAHSNVAGAARQALEQL